MAKAKASAAPDRSVVVRTIHEIYAGPAWHGPSVLAVLRGIDALHAAHRPAPNRNTIWEITLHLAYTRYRLLLRINAKSRERFPRRLTKAWWPAMPAAATEASWRDDRKLLADFQNRLIDAVVGGSDAQLRRVRAGQTRPIADELLGVAIHDAYHAGQIRLIALLQ